MGCGSSAPANSSSSSSSSSSCDPNVSIAKLDASKATNKRRQLSADQKTTLIHQDVSVTRTKGKKCSALGCRSFFAKGCPGQFCAAHCDGIDCVRHLGGSRDRYTKSAEDDKACIQKCGHFRAKRCSANMCGVCCRATCAVACAKHCVQPVRQKAGGKAIIIQGVSVTRSNDEQCLTVGCHSFFAKDCPGHFCAAHCDGVDCTRHDNAIRDVSVTRTKGKKCSALGCRSFFAKGCPGQFCAAHCDGIDCTRHVGGNRDREIMAAERLKIAAKAAEHKQADDKACIRKCGHFRAKRCSANMCAVCCRATCAVVCTKHSVQPPPQASAGLRRLHEATVRGHEFTQLEPAAHSQQTAAEKCKNPAGCKRFYAKDCIFSRCAVHCPGTGCVRHAEQVATRAIKLNAPSFKKVEKHTAGIRGANAARRAPRKTHSFDIVSSDSESIDAFLGDDAV